MTNCPAGPATARSCGSPLCNSSTVAPGAALPAMTASPVLSTRAMSNTGMDSSVIGKLGDMASWAATAFASACAVAAAPPSRRPESASEATIKGVAAPVSIGGSCQTCAMPRTSAAAHIATSARDGTTVRPTDAPAILRHPWPDSWLVCTACLTLRRFFSVNKFV